MEADGFAADVLFSSNLGEVGLEDKSIACAVCLRRHAPKLEMLSLLRETRLNRRIMQLVNEQKEVVMEHMERRRGGRKRTAPSS